MKRIIAFLLVFAAICGVADADGYFVLCKPGSTVNARIRANKKAEVVGWYLCGDYIETDGRTENGFAHAVDVALEVNSAWISKRYLVKDEPITGEWKATVTGKGRVAARRWIGGERSAWLKPGQTVTVYAISAEWCVTNKGYVRTKYLEFAP